MGIMIDLNKTLIDQNDFQYDTLFSNLQGNILKQHGRNHTANIFIKFHKNKEKRSNKWLNDFAEKVTSCKTQLRETEIYKRNNVSGGVFYSFFLSSDGYDYFKQDKSGFTDTSFLSGMKDRQTELDDPLNSKWEIGYREPIHAMILIADSNQKNVGIETKKILDEIEKFSKILTIDYGNAIRNANGDGLEHFGYVDGISQPLFFKEEIENYIGKNTKPLKFNPEAKLNLVLVEDPLAKNEKNKKVEDCCGSYFVFRKLEQDVKNFKKAEEKLADSLIKKLMNDLKPKNPKLSSKKLNELAKTIFDPELAGAMLVGRFEDGTPVTISDKDKMIGSGNFNDFNYSNDKDGAKCPFHSHIRKSNPREDIDRESHKEHIMARRGITYGHRNVNTEIEQNYAQMPTKDVGLLFMSYQKSILNQFEFIQKDWVNNEDFSVQDSGIDPLIGQDGKQNISTGKFATIYNDKKSMCPVPFKSFVTLKGGEYFFAPSIHFLKTFKF